MTKKISELAQVSSLGNSDEFEVNQSGSSRKATFGQIAADFASADHIHTLADIGDSGALAEVDSVDVENIANAAYASQPEATAGSDNSKIMTPIRTAEAIATRSPAPHQHTLSDISDAGPLAGLELVGAGEIAPNAITNGKILSGAVTGNKLANSSVTRDKLALDAVGPDQLEDTAVAPGLYTKADIIIDQQGRVNAATSGTTDGEANTGSNVGINGVGVFETKAGVDLQFRNLAAASSKVTVDLNGADIEFDVVEAELSLPAASITGLAVVATDGTLASLSSLDAGSRSFTNYRAAQDGVADSYTFVQSDSGREKVFSGSGPTTWTVPVLAAGTHAVVHNIGTGDITFSADGVSLRGGPVLRGDRTAALSWLPGNIVKLTGELG
ncbi:MAG: hypothetical protein AAF417_23510 [Pseudomonadota bacterium]